MTEIHAIFNIAEALINMANRTFSTDKRVYDIQLEHKIRDVFLILANISN